MADVCRQLTADKLFQEKVSVLLKLHWNSTSYHGIMYDPNITRLHSTFHYISDLTQLQNTNTFAFCIDLCLNSDFSSYFTHQHRTGLFSYQLLYLEIYIHIHKKNYTIIKPQFSNSQPNEIQFKELITVDKDYSLP